MKSVQLVISIVAILLAGVVFAADVAPIVESERSFSRLAGEKGIRASFLQYLAPDSVLFHGGVVNGQEWYKSRPEVPGNLYWMPLVAGISASGDIGYSTGPWEYRKTAADDKPLDYGTFASIWKKQADGSWKVALDLGCDAPSSSVSVASLEKKKIEPGASGATFKMKDQEEEKKALLQTDRDFSNASADSGLASAYDKWADSSVRIVRDGFEPVSGLDAVKPLLTKPPLKLTWEPIAANIAASGDLGYTYGSSEQHGDPASIRGNYLHVWIRQPGNKWRLVLDVVSSAQP